METLKARCCMRRVVGECGRRHVYQPAEQAEIESGAADNANLHFLEAVSRAHAVICGVQCKPPLTLER